MSVNRQATKKTRTGMDGIDSNTPYFTMLTHRDTHTHTHPGSSTGSKGEQNKLTHLTLASPKCEPNVKKRPAFFACITPFLACPVSWEQKVTLAAYP